MIIFVSKGWLFCQRAFLFFACSFQKCTLLDDVVPLPVAGKEAWSLLPCHLAGFACEWAVESVCPYTAGLTLFTSVRLSWHINVRLCQCYFSSLPICPMLTRGPGVRCEGWAKLLVAILHKGVENHHLRLVFQSCQVRGILFQGRSGNCLIIILCFLWKNYHPLSGDSVAVLRSSCPHPRLHQ